MVHKCWKHEIARLYQIVIGFMVETAAKIPLVASQNRALRVKNRQGRHSPRMCKSNWSNWSNFEGPSPGFTHLGQSSHAKGHCTKERKTRYLQGVMSPTWNSPHRTCSLAYPLSHSGKHAFFEILCHDLLFQTTEKWEIPISPSSPQILWQLMAQFKNHPTNRRSRHPGRHGEEALRVRTGPGQVPWTTTGMEAPTGLNRVALKFSRWKTCFRREHLQETTIYIITIFPSNLETLRGGFSSKIASNPVGCSSSEERVPFRKGPFGNFWNPGISGPQPERKLNYIYIDVNKYPVVELFGFVLVLVEIKDNRNSIDGNSLELVVILLSKPGAHKQFWVQ